MMDLIGNHLWQSTLFAAGAALLTLLFRKNHARVRHALWLSASVKFLIPFSFLIAIGNSMDFSWPEAAAGTQMAVSYVQDISQPFGSMEMRPAIPAGVPAGRTPWVAILLCSMWGCGFAAVLLLYLVKGRRLGLLVRKAEPLTDMRACAALQTLRTASGCRRQIRLASSASLMEPGVYGIFRPVLLLPKEILNRLSVAELEAIIAHEIAHVRRHDNFIAAVHMFIEALFWFHPMVWWLGFMLVKERETACDETVLKLGKNPQSYAEGILKVCEFCLESPLACVSGITGADMKKRIQAIMTHRIGRRLSPAKKLILAIAGLGTFAAPVAVGLFNAPEAIGFIRTPAGRTQPESGKISALNAASINPASGLGVFASPVVAALLNAPISHARLESGQKPSFDTASIKPCQKYSSAGNPEAPLFQPGGRLAGCASLKQFIILAYKSINIEGAPEWIERAEYQIDAKAEGDPDPDQMSRMLQSLLEERFKLKTHRQVKEEDAYALVVAKNGPILTEARDENGDRIVSRKSTMNGNTMTGSFKMVVGKNKQAELGFGVATDMRGLAAILRTYAGRPIINKTGIPGFFDIQLHFPYDQSLFQTRLEGDAIGVQSVPSESAISPIISALEEQLGLKLEPDKALLEFVVIDSIDKPSER